MPYANLQIRRDCLLCLRTEEMKRLYDSAQSEVRAMRKLLGTQNSSSGREPDDADGSMMQSVRKEFSGIETDLRNEIKQLKTLILEQRPDRERDRTEWEVIKEELNEAKIEADRWKSLYQDAEVLINKQKNSWQSAGGSDVKEEMKRLRIENDKMNEELALFNAASEDLTKYLKEIHKLYKKEDEEFVASSLPDIQKISRSLKKALVEWVTPRGHEFSKAVQMLTQLVLQVADSRRYAIDHIIKLREKADTAENSSTMVTDLEEKVSLMSKDLIVADAVVEGLVEELEIAGVSTEADPQSKLYIFPKHSKSSPSKGSFALKRREKDYTRLIVGCRNAMETFKANKNNENVMSYLSKCREELAILQEKYKKDVIALEKMSDEAYLAVKVNVSESERTIEQVKNDYERMRKEESEIHRQIVQELSFNLNSASCFIKQLLFCIGHFMHGADQAKDKYDQLLIAYSIEKQLLTGYAILASDLKTLASLCQGSMSVMEKSLSPGFDPLLKKDSGRKLKLTFKVAAIAVIAYVRLIKIYRQAVRESRVDAGGPPAVSAFSKMIEWPSLSSAHDRGSVEAVQTFRRVSQLLAEMGLQPDDPLLPRTSSATFVKTFLYRFHQQQEALKPRSSAMGNVLTDLHKNKHSLMQILTMQRPKGSTRNQSKPWETRELFCQYELNVLQSFLNAINSSHNFRLRKADNYKVSLLH